MITKDDNERMGRKRSTKKWFLGLDKFTKYLEVLLESSYLI